MCRKGGIHSRPKPFPSCFQKINLPAAAAGVGEELEEESVQEGCKEENQARRGEQRAGQVLKYARWKEESPKRTKSHGLRFNPSQETSIIALPKTNLRNISLTYSHTKNVHTGAQERAVA